MRALKLGGGVLAGERKGSTSETEVSWLRAELFWLMRAVVEKRKGLMSKSVKIYP